MSKYSYDLCRTIKTDKDGERTELSNFVAQIIRETRYTDGRTVDSYLTIAGEIYDQDKEQEVKLPEIEIPAANYPTLNWVLPNWGVRCIIWPGQSIRDELRTAIQQRSTPEITTIYRHLGWTSIDGKRAYLHGKGAIDLNGQRDDVKVQLPLELSRYNLKTDADPVEAARASLALVQLTRPETGWTLLAATMAPLLGPCDFAVHIAGRTGTYKSELASLYQSLYGTEMDARHLPASWSSTANALEAQAYLCANAPIVIDDFVPCGTSWQVRQYQVSADKIIRSQGNQSGRARLTDASSLQNTMYPRGIILSTGEDIPEGQSVRARMMILELAPNEIDTAKLTDAQQKRKILTAITAAYVTHLCTAEYKLSEIQESIRAKCLGIGHTRTPSMLAALTASAAIYLDFLESINAIDDRTRHTLYTQAFAALRDAATDQTQYLETADPASLFLTAVRTILQTGLAHVRTPNGGVPKDPSLLGWTEEGTANEDLPYYRSKGPCIGWVLTQAKELCLDVNAAWAAVKKHAGSDINLTKQVLWRRLKEAGYLTRTDDSRQRNTVRITAESHPRNVVALSLDAVLQESL